MPLIRMSFLTEGSGLCICEGTTTIKSSQEWLKKLYSALPLEIDGFVQVFAPHHIGGTQHLAWAAFAAHLAWKSGSMQARKPEMELSCRVAGTMQIPEAQKRVGIGEGLQEIVLVFVGNEESLPKNFMESLSKKMGITAKPVKWGSGIEVPKTWKFSKEEFAIERSALSE